jgi:hypothetical protein
MTNVSPPVPSKFDKVDRGPEPTKEALPSVPRMYRMGEKYSDLRREISDVQVDFALPLTLQNRLRECRADALIQVSAKDYYPPDLDGNQPLTEATLMEMILDLHWYLRRAETAADSERATRLLAEERLRNSKILVKFLQREAAAAKDTQGIKRPREGRILEPQFHLPPGL